MERSYKKYIKVVSMLCLYSHSLIQCGKPCNSVEESILISNVVCKWQAFRAVKNATMVLLHRKLVISHYKIPLNNDADEHAI